jgi:hypothetical protein
MLMGDGAAWIWNLAVRPEDLDYGDTGGIEAAVRNNLRCVQAGMAPTVPQATLLCPRGGPWSGCRCRPADLTCTLQGRNRP